MTDMDAQLLADLRAAFDRVADRPEFLPDERGAWLDLRKAVEKYLETR